jgi:hypothetical protein
MQVARNASGRRALCIPEGKFGGFANMKFYLGSVQPFLGKMPVLL